MNKKIRTEWEMTDRCMKEFSGRCQAMPDCGPYHMTALGAAWDMNVLIIHGRRCKPSFSFLMLAGGPLKKFQIYSEPIAFSLMMLCPISSSQPVYATCDSNTPFLEVPYPSQTWWHSMARPVDRGILAGGERNAVNLLGLSGQAEEMLT